MAKERVFTYRNVGTSEKPVWEKWFQKTVADAVLMSDGEEETKTIVDYVNQKISELIGGAPEAYNTLKEIADYITSHKSVSDALNRQSQIKRKKTMCIQRPAYQRLVLCLLLIRKSWMD